MHELYLSKIQFLASSYSFTLISYISKREQYVEINETKSDCLTLLTGVLQGSILGPLHFIIYINDKAKQEASLIL